MAELIVSPYVVAGLFAVVAGVYSSVGLGGGSTYIALLTIFGANYAVIPPVSLSLNVVVTGVGTINFSRAGHFRAGLIVPLVVASIPCAYLGGRLAVSGAVYEVMLLMVLGAVAVRIYAWEQPVKAFDLSSTGRVWVSLLVGSAVGLVSGMIGIGGGILLIPCVLLLGLGDEKEAATAGVVFTGLNSVSGLTAHLQRHIPDFEAVVPLLVAVLVGGMAGSYLGASRLAARTVRRVLGLVILAACGLLAVRIFVG